MVTENTPTMAAAVRALKGFALIIAALMIVGAIYYYFVPVNVNTQNGAFGCGTAANPPSPENDGFQYGPCQETAIVNLYRSIALIAGAIVLAAGTFLALRAPAGDTWEGDSEGGERDEMRRDRPTHDRVRDDEETSRRDERLDLDEGRAERRRRSRDQELLDDETSTYPSRRDRRGDDFF